MKIRKTIYLIVGIFFIVFDALATYFIAVDLKRSFHVTSYDMGFFLSTQWILIPGLLFLLGAYRVQRKINRKKREALENAFK
jgi:uncharacterized membrane protein